MTRSVLSYFVLLSLIFSSSVQANYSCLEGIKDQDHGGVVLDSTVNVATWSGAMVGTMFAPLAAVTVEGPFIVSLGAALGTIFAPIAVGAAVGGVRLVIKNIKKKKLQKLIEQAHAYDVYPEGGAGRLLRRSYRRFKRKSKTDVTLDAYVAGLKSLDDSSSRCRWVKSIRDLNKKLVKWKVVEISL